VVALTDRLLLVNRWLYSFILLFSFSAFLPAQTRGKLESITLNEKDFVLMGEDRRGPYLLPDSLIIEHSDKLYLNNVLQPPDAYFIDYINGELRFENSVPKDTEIHLIYKIFPYPLKKSYFNREILHRVFGAQTVQADVNAKPTQTESEDYASQLSKSGSITRGVTMGSNRGLKVNSALNINVSGKVGDNVEVVAALTDQSTPIQPEGTTQNLQEIDKVFIQIKSPSYAATMGDFQIDYSETELSRYNRKLQGVMGEAKYKTISTKVSAAVSRGKYFSMQLMGQEGNQGPFQLKGDRGQIDIIILAGTERVYVDGETMVRGETNDYTIDYSASQITFTRRRLITSDSRIMVDFQYSDEQYRRNLSSAAVDADLWNNKFKIGALLIHEADDKENPLDFTLTDEYRQILQNAGDQQINANVNGAKYVGPQNGRYQLIDSVFVYAGEKLGDYTVSFSDVGANSGDYEYKGNAVFEFVGKNKGRYAPVILLPLPKSHTMMNLSLSVSPFSFLNFKSETAVSQFDNNSFSNIDDQNDRGFGQNYLLSFQPQKINLFHKNLGRFFLSGHYKNINTQFVDIDRTTEVEYNRRWDLPESTSRQEIVKELSSRYEPTPGVSFGGEWGSIYKGDTFNSRRWQFDHAFSLKKLPKVNYRIERIQHDDLSLLQTGDWLRQRGDVQWKLWKISPLFRYEGETKKENWSDSLFTGFRFNDLSGGLSFEPFSQITISGQVSQRKDQDYSGHDKFTDKSSANTQNVQLNFQRLKFWTTTIDFTHRKKTYANSTLEDSRTDLAEIRMQLTPWKRAVSADLNYQISNTATARKERVYIQVPEGEGTYRFDDQLNEYVYDPLGDHILRILTTDQLIPTAELKTSSRLRFEPAKLWESKTTKNDSLPLWVRALKNISSETYTQIEERTQRKEIKDIYLLRLSKFRSPAETIYGSLQFRQDLFLFEHNRDFSLRLRYLSRDELNNQYLEGGENRHEREYGARATNRFTDKFSSQTELVKKQTERTFDYQGRQNRDIYATQLNMDVSVIPTTAFKFALEGRLSWEEDRVYTVPTAVRSYALIPRVTYSIKTRGRLMGEFEWSNVKATPADRILPYEMANGRSIGRSVRWDIRFDYRISDVMQATFSYSGRNEPERHGVIHTGRAQVTAAFR
jgi:hypothetical protein